MRKSSFLFYQLSVACSCLAFITVFLLAGTAAAQVTSADNIVPVAWKQFVRKGPLPDGMRDSREIMANAARYSLAWIPRTFPEDSRHGRYVMTAYNENGIRPASSVCYGLAVVLQCTDLDKEELGVTRQEALSRLRRLVSGVAAAYRGNRPDSSGWGNQWQSALWAALAGQGAWMIWDSLDATTRRMVWAMVRQEADRFIAPDYRVPYWTSADGHVNTPGDTKAEENAWNANILQLAVAMMPGDAHALAWRRVCTELMLSAFALKSDLASDRIVDGKPVRDWLHGFNVRDDGAVINHRRIHPDYTVTITLNVRSVLTQSLARQPVSEAAEWNAAFIYHALARHRWPSPPYKLPGGTMYIPGKAEVYYPQGTDWSPYRFDIYYLTDVDARLLGWDHGLKREAKQWMNVRAKRILAMQARHEDGHMFTKQEYSTYAGKEEMVLWQAADAYLLFWLKSRHALSGTKVEGKTWLPASERK